MTGCICTRSGGLQNTILRIPVDKLQKLAYEHFRAEQDSDTVI